VPDGTISFETCIETRETDISAWPIYQADIWVSLIYQYWPQ